VSGEWVHISEYEDMELDEFLFAATPTQADLEYRLAHGKALLQWLEEWKPRPGSWTN
jgi:hypothetical protein